jgi:hypothetical protein
VFVVACAIWVLGLVTVVPYATYYLLYFASRSEYAALITFILFWIFGFWGIAGPLITFVKVRALFRKLHQAQTAEALIQALHNRDAEKIVIDMIAADNRLPRFVAVRVYRLLMARLAKDRGAKATAP